MNKGLNSDSQIHISVALWIKAGRLITIVVGDWYKAQMRFASIEGRLNDMNEEWLELNNKETSMEKKQIDEWEETKKRIREMVNSNEYMFVRTGDKRL